MKENIEKIFGNTQGWKYWISMGELFDFQVLDKFESIYALETDFQNVNTFLCNLKKFKKMISRKKYNLFLKFYYLFVMLVPPHNF